MTSSRIIWLEYGQYKITDIHFKQRRDVQKFMLEHFRNNRTFQVLKIQEEPGIEEEFLNIVKHILENECSIIVVDNEYDDIKGVALLQCMTEEWRSWTDMRLILDNDRFKELCDMVRWCRRQQAIIHKDNPGGDSLHIFTFSLCEELKEDEEFLPQFFNAICEVARHMHLPRTTYMSLTRSHHERMEAVGFQEMVRVIYSMYKFKNKRPFDHLRSVNEMYGVFYEKKVEALKPFNEMIIRHYKPPEPKDAKRKIPKEEKTADEKEHAND